MTKKERIGPRIEPGKPCVIEPATLAKATSKQ